MGGGTENNDTCHGEVLGKGEVSPVAGLCRFAKEKDKGGVEEIEAFYCK